MRDFLWGTTKVTPESRLGQEVGKFKGYCREAGSMKQVEMSGTELQLHCSKPVYRGMVTEENAPADDWQASTSSRPELQWGPRDPYDNCEANEGNFRQTLTSPCDSRFSLRDLHSVLAKSSGLISIGSISQRAETNTNPSSYKKRQSMETRHILLLIVFITTTQTVVRTIEHPETDAAVQKMLRYAIAQHDKCDYHLFPSQIVNVIKADKQVAGGITYNIVVKLKQDNKYELCNLVKQTPKDHSEMRGSYRVTVMRMLLTLLMLLNIKAWKMGQPPENVWVTLAKTLRQDNLCLSMGSVSSPLSSCLVGIPFKINEPSPLHPFAGNWPALPTSEIGPARETWEQWVKLIPKATRDAHKENPVANSESQELDLLVSAKASYCFKFYFQNMASSYKNQSKPPKQNLQFGQLVQLYNKTSI
ncbi:hypothetical protein DUI87_24311 [Hirundo rustica rustica]|uniref:Cystatin domain-containing protein n=1 Tax=Hirundo rustica rustica TaxID=333673 RepID=A0A3M0JDU1_HIRRU|nr:hypothetical protein DUI87_24311 [Hirundo rustica rustica]